MAVLRLTSKKTLPLLLEALRRESFTQTVLAETEGVSVGRVHKIVSWLKEKGIVVKEKGRYVMVRPNLLTDLIANQQVLSERRRYAIRKEDLERANQMLTACLVVPEGIDALRYHAFVDSDDARSMLEQLPRGDEEVVLFSYESVVPKKDDFIRSVIDLKSVGERSVAEAVAQRLWRTRQ